MKPICYLAQMSLEIQNLIAHFWYESHEEFIMRTAKMIKEISTKSPENPIFQYHNFLDIDISKAHGMGLYSHSPDTTKIAYLDNYYQQQQLTIIDLQKKKEEAILYNEKYYVKYPQAIAISNSADMIAIAREQRTYDDDRCSNGFRKLVESYAVNSILEIRKIATQARRKISLPLYFNCFFIAFNKQETHLIMYDWYATDLKIFSLKDEERNPINIDVNILKDTQARKTIVENMSLNKKPTLQECFRNRGICKQIQTPINH